MYRPSRGQPLNACLRRCATVRLLAAFLYSSMAGIHARRLACSSLQSQVSRAGLSTNRLLVSAPAVARSDAVVTTQLLAGRAQLHSRISGEMAFGRLIEGVVAADATRRGDGDPDRFSGSGARPPYVALLRPISLSLRQGLSLEKCKQSRTSSR